MSKFRKRYEFVDGEAGIIVAKNLKQAIKILCKNSNYSKKIQQEILKECKLSYKESKRSNHMMDVPDEAEWFVEVSKTKDKPGFYGWYE